MSDDILEVRFKHRILFKDKRTKKVTDFGDAVSYSDSSAYSIASQLELVDMKLTDALAAPGASNCTTYGRKSFDANLEGFNFILLSVQAPSGAPVHGFLQFLRQYTDRVALIYLDARHSRGALRPAEPYDFVRINSHTQVDGFRCYLLDESRGSPAYHPEERESNYEPDTTASHYFNDGFSASNTFDSNIISATDDPFSSELSSAAVDALDSSLQAQDVLVGSKRGAEQIAAATHYNELKRERATRHKSHIFHMRNLNNFIKTETISRAMTQAKLQIINERNYVPSEGLSVIDFGCGMGGDIFKWIKCKEGLQRYVGVDIAENSLRHFIEERLLPSARTAAAHAARQRAAAAGRSFNAGDHLKVTHLVCADIGTESLTRSELEYHTWSRNAYDCFDGHWQRNVPLSLDDKFDIASCQFAIHYMFQTEEKAHHFFTEVSNHLKPGGIFVATTTDCRVLSEMLAKELHGEFASAHDEDPLVPADLTSEAAFDAIKTKAAEWRAKTQDGKVRLVFRNDVDNTILTITFTKDMVERLLPCEQHLCHSTISNISNNNKSNTNSIDNSSSSSASSPYGLQYTFTLQDSVEEAAVDAPEWAVPLGGPLEELAAQHGLELVQVENFQDIVADLMRNVEKLNRFAS